MSKLYVSKIPPNIPQDTLRKAFPVGSCKIDTRLVINYRKLVRRSFAIPGTISLTSIQCIIYTKNQSKQFNNFKFSLSMVLACGNVSNIAKYNTVQYIKRCFHNIIFRDVLNVLWYKRLPAGPKNTLSLKLSRNMTK